MNRPDVALREIERDCGLGRRIVEHVPQQQDRPRVADSASSACRNASGALSSRSCRLERPSLNHRLATEGPPRLRLFPIGVGSHCDIRSLDASDGGARRGRR